jgi:transposase
MKRCYFAALDTDDEHRDLSSALTLSGERIAVLALRAVIPNKFNRKLLHAFAAKRYKERNVIERMFGRLKDFRRIAVIVCSGLE